MDTERTSASPDPAHQPASDTQVARQRADDDRDSLLFYTTYGGSKLDPEVRLLAALMAGGQGQGTTGPVMDLVSEELGPKDFSTDPYRQLFTVIVERWRNGEMTDPGSINAALLDQGVSTKPVQALLVEVLGVDVPVPRLPELAKQVLIAWYNRQFQSAATYIQQIADEAPAHEKFRLLQEVGSYQAAADRRIRRFHRTVTEFWASTPESPKPGAVLRQRPTLHTSPTKSEED